LICCYHTLPLLPSLSPRRACCAADAHGLCFAAFCRRRRAAIALICKDIFPLIYAALIF